MIRSALAVCLALALGGCGQLQDATGLPDPFATPHPFQGSGDPALLKGVLGERPIYVGPINGLPPVDEINLRKAIATDASALDVLASQTQTNGSLTLTGTARPKHVDFVLADGTSQVATFAADGDAPLIAATAAHSLAQLLDREGSAPPGIPEPPPLPDVTPPAPLPPMTVNPAPPPSGPAQDAKSAKGSKDAKPAAPKPAAPGAFIRNMKGPSPKQDDPLSRAVADTLAEMGVRMSGSATPDGYAIDGELKLGNDTAGRTDVTIVWTVYSPRGVSLGQAKQANSLPTKAVSTDWASQAALAGQAAAQSIVQLIAADFNAPH